MVHGEHNRSKNSGGFALIILGALLLFLAPNIYGDMRELGTMALVGGMIIGGHRVLPEILQMESKTRIKKGYLLEMLRNRHEII